MTASPSVSRSSALCCLRTQKLLPTDEPSADVLEIIPEEDDLKLGQRKEAYAVYEPLDVPAWLESGLAVDKVVGDFLHGTIKRYTSQYSCVGCATHAES